MLGAQYHRGLDDLWLLQVQHVLLHHPAPVLVERLANLVLPLEAGQLDHVLLVSPAPELLRLAQLDPAVLGVLALELAEVAVGRRVQQLDDAVGAQRVGRHRRAGGDLQHRLVRLAAVPGQLAVQQGVVAAELVALVGGHHPIALAEDVGHPRLALPALRHPGLLHEHLVGHQQQLGVLAGGLPEVVQVCPFLRAVVQHVPAYAVLRPVKGLHHRLDELTEQYRRHQHHHVVAVSDQLHCHGLHLYRLAAVAGDEHFAVTAQHQRAGRHLEAILEAFWVRHFGDPLPVWLAADVLATRLHSNGVVNATFALRSVKRGCSPRRRSGVLDEVSVTLGATMEAE